MKPRERVLRAIERTEPDRVPIDFGGTCWSIVDSPHMPYHPYHELCKYLGIEDYAEPSSEPLMYEVNNVDERILQRFGVDIRYMYPHDLPLRYDPQGGAIVGAFGMRMKPVGYYGEADRYPMRDLNTVQEIEDYPDWPDPDHPVYMQEGLREEAVALREQFEEYAIGIDLVDICGVQFDLAGVLFGIDRWMYNLKNRPDLHHAWMNKYLRVTDKIVKNILSQVGDIVDIVVIVNDFGTQQGPFVSYDDYVKHLKPYEARQIARVKEGAPNARILMHSCGSIITVIKDRAEMGVDVQNPMNPLAKNMNAEYLKEHFGNIISFHGGGDIQRLLPFGTPEKIQKEVKRLIKIWMPTGGWIAAPSHNIQPDTPPENIVAMYDTLQEFGDGKFVLEV
jgi:uroporphyrinogen decarboxylase